MIDDIQKHFDKFNQDHNNREIPEFEGYSPNEMQFILYDTFGENSPVRLQRLTESDYKSVPILNQVKYLVNLVKSNGELKLTEKGFLPVKIVSDIYNQGFIKDELVESGLYKLYKEADSLNINLTRIVIEISGLVKKRNNKLSLTKTGEKIISDDYNLLLLIFNTIGVKFNWGYYDRYEQNEIGKLGFGFSLILLSKYGNKKRKDEFYSEKYFKAFPQLRYDTPDPGYSTIEQYTADCYSIRTFDRFLEYFGLITIESENKWPSEKYITKTGLFDKLIKCNPHRIFHFIKTNYYA